MAPIVKADGLSDRHFVDLSRSLLRSVDRDRVLNAIARALCEVSRCDRCLLVEYDPTNGDTHTRAAHGMSDGVIGISSNAHHYDLSVQALAMSGPVYDHHPENAPAPQSDIMAILEVSNTVVAIAMRSEEMGTMGIAYLDRPGLNFELTPEEADGLTRFADVASLALQHSILVDRSRALARMTERSRLASELHDGVTQQLFVAGLELDGILERDGLDDALRDSVDRALRAVRTGGGQLREALTTLTQPKRTGTFSDLIDEIRTMLGNLLDDEGIAGELYIQGDGPEPVGEQRALVRRMVLEGLRNVAKHAQATEVAVSLRRSAQWCVIEVEDDGRGDPSVIRRQALVARPGGGYGFASLVTEASRLGGRGYIERSRRLGGISVSVALPL